MVINILLLGVVDDQNVYKWIKCKIWFSVNAKKVDDVSLDGRTKLFEVKYFLRYLYYIPIITKLKTRILQDFFSNFEVTVSTSL